MPNIGEPFDTNVFIVTFAGPISSIFGVGSIDNPCSLNEPLNPKITNEIAIEAIMAPMASEGGCINKLLFLSSPFSLLEIDLELFL